MQNYYNTIKENLERIQWNIWAAAQKSGRKAEDITLISVTKTIDIERIQALTTLGVKELGENRVQEIQEKHPHITGANWHMIGHLQTNKVKYVIDKVDFIHSVDSLKLGQEISKRATELNKNMNILIEINIGEEQSKFGISTEKALILADELSQLNNINVCGLMCVAPFVENAEKNRLLFKKMNQIFVDIKYKINNNMYMQHLSMGMTNDYQVAIEEGATMVRIGTGLFGNR